MAYFQCEKCGHSQGAPEQAAGKSTKCPKCKEPGVIVAANDSEQNSLITIPPIPQSPQHVDMPVKVHRCDGGSIKIPLGARICVNEKSSLHREWITIVDPLLPVEIIGCIGLTTTYKDRTDYNAGGYYYRSRCSVKVSENVSAFELKFLTFDVWGEHEKTLVATELLDLTTGQTYECKPEWNLYSENEASLFLASIAFISRVRTAQGRVLVADTHSVMEEAHRFTAKFKENDFEPTKNKP